MKYVFFVCFQIAKLMLSYKGPGKLDNMDNNKEIQLNSQYSSVEHTCLPNKHHKDLLNLAIW